MLRMCDCVHGNALILVVNSQVCITTNDNSATKRVGRQGPTKKLSNFVIDSHFYLSVSFVGENLWEPTDLGVTPNNVPTNIFKKLVDIPRTKYNYIYVLLLELFIY